MAATRRRADRTMMSVAGLMAGGIGRERIETMGLETPGALPMG